MNEELLKQLEKIIIHIYQTAYRGKPAKTLRLQTIISRWPKTVPLKHLVDAIKYMKGRGRIGEEEGSVYRLLI